MARKAVSTFESATGLTAVPVDVWLDGQGRVRQLTLTLTIPSSATGAAKAMAGATMDLRIGIGDFGVPVHVSAPPASSVTRIAASGAGLG